MLISVLPLLLNPALHNAVLNTTTANLLRKSQLIAHRLAYVSRRCSGRKQITLSLTVCQQLQKFRSARAWPPWTVAKLADWWFQADFQLLAVCFGFLIFPALTCANSYFSACRFQALFAAPYFCWKRERMGETAKMWSQGEKSGAATSKAWQEQNLVEKHK